MHSVRRIADTIVQWSLIALAALIPFFALPISWMSIPQAKFLFLTILTLIALIAWLIGRLIEGAAVIPKHFLTLGALLLPIAYLISSLMSGNVWSSIVSGNTPADTAATIALWYSLLVLSAIVFSSGHVSVATFLRAFIGGLCILLLFQIVRLFAPGITSLGGYLSGNAASLLGSWHDLGIISGLGLFLVFALWDTVIASKFYMRILLALTGVGAFVMTIVVNSVDVWYALFALAAIFGVWRLFTITREGYSVLEALSSRLVWLWVLLALLSVLCGIFSSKIYDHLPKQMQVVQLEVRPSWSGTYQVGQQVLKSPKNLIFGSGPNTFNRNWALFKPVGVNYTDYWNVDFNAGIGFIPTTLVTTGALGLIAWATIIFGLLLSFMRLLRSRGGHSHTILFALVGGALYTMAFHIMYLPGVALSALLFLFMGCIVAIEWFESSRSPMQIDLQSSDVGGIARIIIFILIGGVFALASFVIARAILSSVYVQRAAVVYSATGKLDQPLALTQKAIRIDPKNDVAHRAAVELGLLQLSAIIQKNDDAARTELQSKLQSTISHALSAVSIDSADYQNWLSLAVLYKDLAGVGIEGAYENAKQAYEKTIAEYPSNPLPHVQLAQLALAQGDAQLAQSELDKAIALKPNLGAAYFLRSQIKASQSSYASAIDDAAAAAQLVPQDPVGWYNLGSILFAAQSYDLSAQALERAVSLQTNYANAMFLLGLAWDKIGRSGDALTIMQLVQQQNPNDQTVATIVENLKAGKPAVPQNPPTEQKSSKTR